jgi:hypothetical protein
MPACVKCSGGNCEGNLCLRLQQPCLPKTAEAPVGKGDSRWLPVHGLPGDLNSILPMPKLAYLLSRFATERPIIDMTGLGGMYDAQSKA